MYIHVRFADGKDNKKSTFTISKLSTVGVLKKLVEKEFEVPVKKQRLFFRGKQLENGYKLFDYDVNFNDVIQLVTLQDPLPNSTNDKKTSDESQASEKKTEKEKADSLFYRVNDIVDAKDNNYGSWFEGKILDIFQDPDKKDYDRTDRKDDGLLYRISLLRFPDDDANLVTVNDVRPRGREWINLKEVSPGDRVMVNFNMEEPKERGYWYDFLVDSVEPKLIGTLFVGSDETPLEKTTIKFNQEIMKIEPVKLLSERSDEELELMQTETNFKRKYAPYCSKCLDDNKKKCKECSCNKCGGKDQPGKQLFCDECNLVFHLWCLDPPLSQLPNDDHWYCKDCKLDENEIVKVGDKLKLSKKKSRMASYAKSASSKRDWGVGMACVGRTKECTLVPPNHFGPIPGVEVGTSWKFRVQVSEAGVHRPHVAGISGRENEGAYSIVLSGGYEDDVDNGDEFMYTGSGGRDLSGNKRTAQQSSDQTLTRMNKALAINCNVAVNEEKGAEAKNWKGGKPVRVVRNYKAAKHSKYAPEEGNRYDGIYKVVKYYPEKGKSGYIVWRYLLRRDDPDPAPWTDEGKQKIESLGLEMLYPDGYLEAMESKERSKMDKDDKKTPKGKKRLLETNHDDERSPTHQPQQKMIKLSSYELESNISEFIDKDQDNNKLWAQAKENLSLGKQKFLSKVEEIFMCICCQELLFKPITTPCSHNICKDCLTRSFEAEVYSCPHCRTQLGKSFPMEENDNLQSALLMLFPGYTAAR